MASGKHVASAVAAVAESLACRSGGLGSHGRRGFDQLMLGSDAEQALRWSNVPMLLVRHDIREGRASDWGPAGIELAIARQVGHNDDE